MDLDRIYALAKRVKQTASLFTADGRIHSIAPGNRSTPLAKIASSCLLRSKLFDSLHGHSAI